MFYISFIQCSHIHTFEACFIILCSSGVSPPWAIYVFCALCLVTLISDISDAMIVCIKQFALSIVMLFLYIHRQYICTAFRFTRSIFATIHWPIFHLHYFGVDCCGVFFHDGCSSAYGFHYRITFFIPVTLNFWDRWCPVDVCYSPSKFWKDYISNPRFRRCNFILSGFKHLL